MRTRGRYLIAMIAFTAASNACAPVPWGDGAVALPPASARVVPGIQRHVDADALVDAATQLTTITDGSPARLVGPGTASGYAFDTELSIGALDFETDPTGLVLVSRIPESTIHWWRTGPLDDPTADCAGVFTLGPGSFRIKLDFVSDKLGRITTALAERAEWTGPFTHSPDAANGPSCADRGGLALAELLARRVPATIATHEGGAIARALGFSLAAPLNFPLATAHDAIRVHLRAREELPVTLRDDGLSAYFELHIQAETAPCLAPWTLATESVEAPETQTTSATTGKGLFVPTDAIRGVLEAVTLAGGFCGTIAPYGVAIPGDDLASLVPSWAAVADGDALGLVSLQWAPHGPAVAMIDPSDKLLVGFERVSIAMYGTWGGALWRLGGFEGAVSAEIQLEVQRNGAVVVSLGDVTVSDVVADSGLLHAPSTVELEAIVHHAIADLVDGQELIRLPASLAPVTTEAARMSYPASGVLLPTR